MKLLRVLVNGWLIALAVDGGLRVLVGLLQLAFGSFPAGMLIGPVELVSFVGGLVAWVGVAVASQIPKRVVLPPLIAICWVLCGALPFSVLFFNSPGFQLGIGLVLLGSVALSEGLARSAGHGRWFLAEAPLGGAADLSARRALGWVGGWLALGPIALALYTVGGSAWALWYGTAGFLTMTPQGLAAAHKTYTQGEDTVDLIAMIHLGEPSAYAALFEGIPSEGTLVLAEGVSDEQGLLTAPRDAYQTAANTVGLSVQAPIEQIAPFEVRIADVDVSSFDPVSIELLNAALGIYSAPDNPEKALTDYLAFWSGHRTDANEVIEQLFADILDARNAHLLTELERARASRDRLVVPWGALHMVGIEAALREQGWTHTHTDKVVLIRWSTVF